MVQSIFDDVKKQFQQGNAITRLIIVNVGIYIAINILYILFTHLNGGATHVWYYNLTQGLSLSSDWWKVVTHPWSILTHMILHEGFWHVLWNMLFIYWFGRIIGDFIGDNHVTPLFVLGGLLGALFYFLSANLLPYSAGRVHYAMGASAGAMAFVVGAATLSPDYNMRLLFLGNVKLKYIAGALVFIDMVGTAGDMNTGGHFGHLGGALLGYLYIIKLREGKAMGTWVNTWTSKLGSLFVSKAVRRSKLKIVHHYRERKGDLSYPAEPKDDAAELDRILDKIKAEGLSKLTDEERKFLNEMSNS